MAVHSPNMARPPLMVLPAIPVQLPVAEVTTTSPPYASMQQATIPAGIVIAPVAITEPYPPSAATGSISFVGNSLFQGIPFDMGWKG